MCPYTFKFWTCIYVSIYIQVSDMYLRVHIHSSIGHVFTCPYTFKYRTCIYVSIYIQVSDMYLRVHIHSSIGHVFTCPYTFKYRTCIYVSIYIQVSDMYLRVHIHSSIGHVFTCPYTFKFRTRTCPYTFKFRSCRWQAQPVAGIWLSLSGYVDSLRPPTVVNTGNHCLNSSKFQLKCHSFFHFTGYLCQMPVIINCYIHKPFTAG